MGLHVFATKYKTSTMHKHLNHFNDCVSNWIWFQCNLMTSCETYVIIYVLDTAPCARTLVRKCYSGKLCCRTETYDFVLEVNIIYRGPGQNFLRRGISLKCAQGLHENKIVKHKRRCLLLYELLFFVTTAGKVHHTKLRNVWLKLNIAQP